jgi:hypothetical protein
MKARLSCPANGSRECAPDDRLRRDIQYAAFAEQALVILVSPAVSLASQPEMVSEPAKA